MRMMAIIEAMILFCAEFFFYSVLYFTGGIKAVDSLWIFQDKVETELEEENFFINRFETG